MSNNDETSENMPSYIPLIAGGFSGVMTRFICQPLDVIKIRFQLQVEPIHAKSAKSKYRSIPQAFGLIVKEEGLVALWKGHLPAQLLSMTFGVVQFGAYEYSVRHAKEYPLFAENKAKTEFIGGFMAGCLATIVCSPFDVLRTRLIAQGKTKVYRSTLHGLTHILRHEGFRGWFKGLSPNLIQIGPVTGIQFASYHFYKRVLHEIESHHNVHSKWLSMSEIALAGSLSGFTAKICTYPLDLFKKRMQFQGFQEARKGYGKNFVCTNLVTCLHNTIKEEKLLGLFKGLTPSLIKASIVNALIFTIYEEALRILVELHNVRMGNPFSNVCGATEIYSKLALTNITFNEVHSMKVVI